MSLLARFRRFCERRREARFRRWARKNKVLLAPDRAVSRSVNTGSWT